MGDVTKFRNGFRKESHAKIMKVIKKKQLENGVLNEALLGGLTELIKSAFDGGVAQMQIGMGDDPTTGKKIRIIVCPNEYGDVLKSEDPSKPDLRILTVPEDLDKAQTVKIPQPSQIKVTSQMPPRMNPMQMKDKEF